MTDFTEVIKQKNRMCESMVLIGDCDKCGLSYLNNSKGLFCSDLIKNFPKEAEKIIIKWASEHPEQRYPTWAEWQKENFPDATSTIRPCTLINVKYYGCIGGTCSDCINKSIPERIAKKLGIKPKEIKP